MGEGLSGPQVTGTHPRFRNRDDSYYLTRLPNPVLAQIMIVHIHQLSSLCASITSPDLEQLYVQGIEEVEPVKGLSCFAARLCTRCGSLTIFVDARNMNGERPHPLVGTKLMTLAIEHSIVDLEGVQGVATFVEEMWPDHEPVARTERARTFFELELVRLVAFDLHQC